MLPGKDGFSVVSELRAAKNYVPVLMLTARGRPEDVLKGFASGADDYLAKPFDLSILLARLQGLLRRSEWMRRRAAGSSGTARNMPVDPSHVGDFGRFSFAGKSIDFGTLELRSQASTIHLTLMEVGTTAPSGAATTASWFPASRFSKKSGDCMKTPTLAPSTTSWCACGAISKMIRDIRGTC